MISVAQAADLFGHPIPKRMALLKKRKAPVPQGYAATPGTGPAGETCGSCGNHAIVQHAKAYHKCRLMRQMWTGGIKTDIRVRSQACSLWAAKT